ncbi:MAG: sigma-70 family RNA polymerase sigma factor [Lachnospiraceae bacterium]|nr:sigma-70 family RNA polymerase sigma factor [Lachnospiraceae bacterium]
MTIEEIYKEYHDKVMAYIRNRVNNLEDAEDLCADVFLKIQQRYEDYDKEKAAVSTWIYAITRNTVIDHYRVNRISEELPEDIASEETIDTDIIRKETLGELADALLQLSEEERTVIVLHYYEGLTLKQIEAKTGLSYGKVKLRHNSAIDKMKIFFRK